MKTIILGRHAKSDWENPLLKDYERPLNTRGLLAAPMMGKRLLQFNWLPDYILTSHANRAATTAKLIAQEINYPLEKIEIEMDLYECDLFTHLKVINRISNTYSFAATFAHSTSCAQLAEYLTGEKIGHIPTCALICMQFPCETWAEISGNTGNLVWLDVPRNEFSKITLRI